MGKIWFCRQGTSLTEYALVMLFIGLTLAGFNELMLPAVHKYLQLICVIVSLPIP